MDKNVKAALNSMKMEAAKELGITLKDGNNGQLTAREAGSIGGKMVQKMIDSYKKSNF